MTSGDFGNGAVSKDCTVGQLVAESPTRAGIFDEYGIDYCCGGKLTLEEACRRKGIRVTELIDRLQSINENGSTNGERDWTKTSLADLIEHIVFVYHRPLQQQLSRALPLAEKVATVHGDRHPEMVEVMHIFKTFAAQLELHMHKEEMILFPAIAGIESGRQMSFGCGGGIEMPIGVMTQEHDEAGEALAAMQKLTNNFTPPADACNSFRVLLHLLSEINTEMHWHVHKENNILFPRAISMVQTGPSCSSKH